MRAPWTTPRSDSRPANKNDRNADYLTDALTLLAGWSRGDREITRTLPLDDAQHAALTERIKVVSDALRLRPEIRRVAGETQIRLGTPSGAGLTEGTVTMAARIEDAYRTITGRG